MAKAFLIKKADGSFLPAYDEDHETLKKIKMGEAIEVSWTKLRSVKNNGRFHAMLNCTIQNMPESIPDRFSNKEYLRGELLIQTGYCEWRTSLGGNPYPIPKSMRFDSMDEVEFDVLYSLVSAFILKHFLPGLDEKTFEKNIDLFM